MTLHTSLTSLHLDGWQLDDVQRELEDLRLENRIFKSYYGRHASDVATDADDDKRKTNRQRRRQLPSVLTIEQKVEIGVHEQEVAHKDVSTPGSTYVFDTGTGRLLSGTGTICLT